ncbi:hypothetical protein, partial [Schumannella sp. 10F1B-5-1]
DELIGMLPELAPLRDEIAADDAAFGQSVVESFGLDGSGLAQSLAGGGQSRPVRAISDGQVLGNVLVGGFAPDVVSAAMDQV